MVRHALLRHIVKMCLCQHWVSLEFVMAVIFQGFLMVLLLGCRPQVYKGRSDPVSPFKDQQEEFILQ